MYIWQMIDGRWHISLETRQRHHFATQTPPLSEIFEAMAGGVLEPYMRLANHARAAKQSLAHQVARGSILRHRIVQKRQARE